MDIIELELSYGNLTIYNLFSTWIQRKTMSPGYMLCYEDDIYNRGIIYRSVDKLLLLNEQDKLMKEIEKGQKRIRL